jgi:hypothetical protein
LWVGLGLGLGIWIEIGLGLYMLTGLVKGASEHVLASVVGLGSGLAYGWLLGLMVNFGCPVNGVD